MLSREILMPRYVFVLRHSSFARADSGHVEA
jgi:hypothetical protein